jgi:WD40 repeat protein
MSALADSIDSTPVDRREEPWLGLESYSEADAERFYGREAETTELLRLLRRDVLTVVFGPSGTGKTSLLKAGLFPKLRDEYFLPVAIRVDYSHKRQSLISQVRAGITLACADGEVEESFRGEGVVDREETLWEYLHGAVFWDKRNNPITPVIVFDQFEEIFTLGHDHPARGEFLVELSDLIENYIPDTVRERMALTGRKLGFDAAEQRYKVLIALREDFVSRLDGLRKAMPSVMHNRFALTRMDGEQALRPVTLPGGGIVSDAVAEQIVRKVASADPAIPLKDLAIDPALLSLMCRELNARRLREGRKTIAAELVNNAASDILIDFYERSFQGLNAHAQEFVEDRLLTSEGFRTTVALAAAVREGLRGDMEVLVNRRLIRSEERLGLPHLELTHDVLTKVALASRKEREARLRREEEERRKSAAEAARTAELARTRSWLVGVGVAGILCLVLAVLAFLSYRSAKKSAEDARQAKITADKESKGLEEALTAVKKSNDTAVEAVRDEVKQRKNAEASLLQSNRALARVDVQQAVSVAKSHPGHALAFLERALKYDATSVLAQSWMMSLLLNSRWIPDLILPEASIREAKFSPDGNHVLTVSDSDMVQLWDPQEGIRVGKPIDPGGRPQYVDFSPTSQTILTAAGRTARLWNAETGELVAELPHLAVIENVNFSATGKLVATAAGGLIQVWNVAGGTLFRKLAGVPIQPEILKLSWDGERLVTVKFGRLLGMTVANDTDTKLWNVETGSSTAINYLTMYPKNLLPPTISDLAFGESGDLILSNSTRLVRIGTDGSVQQERDGNYGSLSRDGRWVVLYSPAGGLNVVEVSTNRVVKIISLTGRPKGTFSDDGKYLSLLAADGSRVTWDLTRERAPVSETLAWEDLQAGTPNADGTRALWKAEGRLYLWRAAPYDWGVRAQPAPQPQQPNQLHAVAFDDEGHLLLRNGSLLSVRDSESAKELRRLEGVRALFFPMGARSAWNQRYAVAEGGSGIVEVRDITNGALVGQRLGPLAGLKLAALSPNGRYFISVADDGKALFWDVQSGSNKLIPYGVGARMSQF